MRLYVRERRKWFEGLYASSDELIMTYQILTLFLTNKFVIIMKKMYQKRKLAVMITAIMCAGVVCTDAQTLPSFPGAEGHGAGSVGGRG